MNLVSVNGVVDDSERTSVHWSNRGLLYGDGLFETIRIDQGVACHITRHLERLFESAAYIEMTLPGEADIRDWISQYLRAVGADRCALRLTATRGNGDGISARDSALPTVLLHTRRMPPEPDPSGETLAIARAQFQAPRLGRRLKSLDYLPAVVSHRELTRQGVREGVLLSSDGELMEGTVSNLFGVIDGVLRTAPVARGVLPGTTRSRVMEAAVDCGLEVTEQPLTMRELGRAQEVFYTNALRGIVPVRSIRGLWEAGSDAVTRQLQSGLVGETGS